MNQTEFWEDDRTTRNHTLAHREGTICIDSSKLFDLEGQRLKLKIDKQVHQTIFKRELKKELQTTSIHFSEGYMEINPKHTAELSEERWEHLQHLAEQYYIHLGNKPFLSGTITAHANAQIKEQMTAIAPWPSDQCFQKYGLIYLTLEEWKQMKNISGVYFDDMIGAIFQIKPSLALIIESFYEHITISQTDSRISVGGELHHQLYQMLHELVGLTKIGNSIVFEFEDVDAFRQKFSQLRKKGICFKEFHPEDGKLTYFYSEEYYATTDSSLDFEITQLSRLMRRHFAQLNYSYHYLSTYSFDFKQLNNCISQLFPDETEFWNRLFATIHGADFQVSKKSKTISFDFESEEELDRKRNQLHAMQCVNAYDREEQHRYKFNIRLDTGLQDLQLTLKRLIPRLETKILANGEKLIFRKFYEANDKLEEAKQLQNQLQDCIDGHLFRYEVNEGEDERYVCKENVKLKTEQEQKRLLPLLHEKFYCEHVTGNFCLGVLQQAYYPSLQFDIAEENRQRIEEAIANQDIKLIFPIW